MFIAVAQLQSRSLILSSLTRVGREQEAFQTRCFRAAHHFATRLLPSTEKGLTIKSLPFVWARLAKKGLVEMASDRKAAGSIVVRVELYARFVYLI